MTLTELKAIEQQGKAIKDGKASIAEVDSFLVDVSIVVQDILWNRIVRRRRGLSEKDNDSLTTVDLALMNKGFTFSDVPVTDNVQEFVNSVLMN